jgi:osmotically-inducible protein OsmY
MKNIKSILYILGIVFATTSSLMAQPEVVSRLKKELSAQSGLQSYAVSASSINGKLLIVGETATEREKNIIIETAQNIPGVRALREEIIVNPAFGQPVYTDEEIKKNIEEALQRSSLEASGIAVKEGHVVLSGDYPSFRKVDEISSIILTSPGVQNFSTNVTINGKDYMDQFGGVRTGDTRAEKKSCCAKKKDKKKHMEGEKKKDWNKENNQ